MQVFICHSSEDKKFVLWLAGMLVKMGVRPWYDQWEIKVGDSIVDKISQGLQESDALIAVLSKASVGSRWVKEELCAAISEQVDSVGIKILPLLLEDCDIPFLLRSRRYADFRLDQAEGLKELMRAINLRGHLENELKDLFSTFLQALSLSRGTSGSEQRWAFVELHSCLQRAVEMRFLIEAVHAGTHDLLARNHRGAFFSDLEFLIARGFPLRSRSWAGLNHLRNLIVHGGSRDLTENENQVLQNLQELQGVMKVLVDGDWDKGD